MDDRSLLAWLDAPAADRGVSFLRRDGDWERHPYDELAAAAEAAATGLAGAAAGREGGDRYVAIVLASGPRFLAAFFGALRAGLTPCPLVPPSPLQRRAAYVDHLSSILAIARPVAIVTDADSSDAVAEAARRAGVAAPVLDEPAAAGGGGRAGEAPPRLGLLQFTSGSTGRPRGVRVTLANLDANMAMMRRWVDFGPEDAVASWLPLYHDMGLIGTLLTPISLQLDVHVMLPEQFVERPLRWLECFGRLGATHTATPSFGFGYAAKRVEPSDLAGLDLSGWRAAIAGAERLDPVAMARFARLAAPAGFRAETFRPAFGLAEATLAVTGVPLDEVASVVRLDWSSLRLREPVRVLDHARVDELERVADGDGWALDCGAPLAGVEVAVVDADGEPLPDGHLGEVLVRGPSVADGYCDDDRSASRFAGGAIRTGDVAFLRGGRLFVLGRIADGLSLRGRNVYAEDLEGAIATIEGVSRGRCAVFTGIEPRCPAIVAIVESEPGPWAERVGRRLTRAARTDASVYVLRADRGTILRTSSGKPRRHAMFEAFLDGTLAADVVWGNAVADRARLGERAESVPAGPA